MTPELFSRLFGNLRPYASCAILMAAVGASTPAETGGSEPCAGSPCRVSPEVGATRRLALADVGLSLDLPAAWKLKQPDAGPFAAIAELPPRQALALLTRTPIAADDSPSQGLDDLLAELPRSFDQYEILAMGRQRLTPDLHGDVVEVRGAARGRTLRHITYLVEGFGERFALTFATEELRHAELASRFEEIVSSLELAGPDPHSARFLDQIKTDPLDLEQLRQLLESGADIDATDRDGFNALAIAVFSGNSGLTRWLLDRGADPGQPEKLASLLPLVASPPIYELLLRANPAVASTPRGGVPVGLEIHWTSPEAQLLTGIKNARLADVEAALRAGADLDALEPGYGLSALPLTRRLIEEFEQLELDPSRFLPIESLLLEAVKADLSQSPRISPRSVLQPRSTTQGEEPCHGTSNISPDVSRSPSAPCSR